MSFDDVARGQHGVITRRQVLDLVGNPGLQRAVRSGHLMSIGAGVFRCAGASPTFRQRAMAACLLIGPPVAVSHRSAALLWGYEAVHPGPVIEVSIPKGRSGRRSGIRAYRVSLAQHDMAERFGIAVTGPGRTLLDLAADLPLSVVERCVDDALRARQATADELADWLGREDRNGYRGVKVLRRLLERRVASGVGDSAGVDRVHRWITRAGLPAPVLGLSVVVAGRVRLIDLGYPAQMVAVEFNGWEFHQMRSRMDADHARTTELELAGWLVIVVTAAHGEVETVDRIGRALAMRRRRPAAPGREG